MTDQDYTQLEALLCKLSFQFDERYAISITPNVVHDMYSIGLYDRESGKYIDNAFGMDIKDAISKLKLKTSKQWLTA